MIDIFKVDANLMRPPRLRIKLNKRNVFTVHCQLHTFHFILRHRFFPSGHDAKALAIPRETPDGCTNFSLRGLQFSMAEGKICFVNDAFFKLPLKIDKCLWGFGDQKYSRSFFVQPMHNPRPANKVIVFIVHCPLSTLHSPRRPILHRLAFD